MLAIFDQRVAKCPESMKSLHPNAVSALKDDFLVNHFKSIYPDSEVVIPTDSFTFAYSLDDTSGLTRFNYAHVDSVYCMYQGVIKDIETVKTDLKLAEIHEEGILMLRAFQILRHLGHRTPKTSVEDLSGNCISVFYESTSKLVVLSGGSYYGKPLFWGVDSMLNLVISDNETVVEKACGAAEPFVSGKVYACCGGRTRNESILSTKQPVFKVNYTDKLKPKPQTIETVKTMIIQADKDRSQPSAERWEPPMGNFLKMNTYGLMLEDGMLGLGIIIRNSSGEIEFAANRKKENILANLDPVVHGFSEGLYMAKELKLKRCVIESVHLNLDRAKNEFGLVPLELEMVIGDMALLMLNYFTEFSVSFVSSSANEAAHRLALSAKETQHTVWEKKIPECIASIVESECPNHD